MNRKQLGKAALGLGLPGLALLAFASQALAFESRSGNVVRIEAGEVVADDLYVSANEFILDGAIEGDLVVAGQTILVNGTVGGDLIAAGQTIVVEGQVADDARLAGAVLQFGEGAQLGDDLVAASYSLEAAPGSAIEGDVVYAGNQALLAGTVGEAVQMSASAVALRGEVAEDVVATIEVGDEAGFTISPWLFMPGAPEVPALEDGLTIADEARIGGDLRIETDAEVAVPPGVVAGQVVREELDGVVAEPEGGFGTLAWLLDQLRYLAALLLIGLLMLWLAPALTRRAARALQERPLPSLGWGLAVIAGVFLALLALAVLVTVLAIVFGVLTLGNLVGATIAVGVVLALGLAVLFGLAAVYLSKVVVSYLGGRLLLRGLSPALAQSRLWPLVLGLLIFVILAAIPYLGWLVNLVVIILGLGALWLALLRSVGQPEAVAAAGGD